MTSCLLCTKPDKNKLNSNIDCVIEYLEQIKLHYLALKSEYAGNRILVENLKQQNLKLSSSLEQLNNENSGKKRRKTNSLDCDEDIDNLSPSESVINSISKCVLADKSADDLNKALITAKIDSLDDESFFVSSQTLNSPKMLPLNLPRSKPVSGRKLLQDKLNIIDTPDNSRDMERDVFVSPTCKQKKDISVKNQKLENRDPQSVSKWVSKEQSKVKTNKVYCRDWNLSVIRPIKPTIENSEESVTPPKLSTSNLSLPSTRLRQTRLKFDEVKQEKGQPVKDADETFCGDIVEASPTVLLSINKDCNKTGRKRNIRTKCDNENVFDSKKSDSSPPPAQEEDTIYSNSVRKIIKMEPATLNKKSALKLKIPKAEEYKETSTNPCNISNVEQFNCSSSSSVLILPSQPEDFILVEESDNEFDDNINSLDLINVMKNKSDCSSDFLSKVEEKCIKKLKNEQARKNNLKAEKIMVAPSSAAAPSSVASSSTALKENEKSSLKFDCQECQKYANFIGRNLNDEEIAKRMKECCRHKKPVRLNDTPDGFWNPEFAPTPINETLIDTRFIKK